MSIDLGVAGRGITYLNFRATQDTTGTKTCRATQEFNYSNFIDDSSDYILAIERLGIPIHKVPMIPAIAAGITLVDAGAGGGDIPLNVQEAFSLKEWLISLNRVAEPLAQELYFKLDASGRIQIYFNDYANYSLRFDRTIADIFELPVNNAAPNNGTLLTGGCAIFDRFDQMYKVQIEASGLNVAREVINTDTTLPILTDIIVPTNYAISYTEPEDEKVEDNDLSIAYPTRQAVLYGGENERRYINMVGRLAVQNITIQAVAIYRDGTRNQIILPKRGIFECKLGFYKK